MWRETRRQEDDAPPARVLTIAGSDSGGGAGIEADIKTISAFGGYAMTAITAITAQNTRGVFGIHETPAGFVRQQIELVIDDLGVDAIKTGMLASAATIATIAELLVEKSIAAPLIIDPVTIAKGGARLLPEAAIAALIKKLMPLATLITPNIPEAEALSGGKITDLRGMKQAAARILEITRAKAVLVKGGHLPADRIFDVLLSESQYEVFESTRIPTTNTHGTGCTLASAIATRLAQGWPLENAVASGRDYVRRAIAAAPGFGHGHGPLLHTVPAES